MWSLFGSSGIRTILHASKVLATSVKNSFQNKSCNLYSDLRTELLNGICALNPTLKDLSHENLLNILLYGSENFIFNTNKKIMKSTNKFLKISERFIGPIF